MIKMLFFSKATSAALLSMLLNYRIVYPTAQMLTPHCSMHQLTRYPTFGGSWNIESEMHLQPKSREISFADNLLLYNYELSLILALISDYIHYKVWDKTTYPFPNFNGAKLHHVYCKGGPWGSFLICQAVLL